jgi:hypothetical protein
MYTVYLINTPELPIPYTHGVFMRKFQIGFRQHGCNTFEINSFKQLNEINDSPKNIFLYSNHYNPQMIYNIMNKIALLFEQTIHIGWYFHDIVLTKNIPLKKVILTGQYSFENRENHGENAIRHIKHNIYHIPLFGGSEIDPKNLKIMNKDKCLFNSCFVGTPYKKNWVAGLEKCYYYDCVKNNRLMIGEEKIAKYNNSVVMLGFHSDNNKKLRVISDRIYEGLRSCCVVLTDSPAASEITNGVVEYVENQHQLRERINFYVNNKVKRDEKIAQGIEYLKKEGTFYYCAKIFLEHIQKTF